MVVPNWLEVWVIHCIAWSDSLSMVVPQHLVKQVKCLISNELLVLRSEELAPWLAWMLTQNIVVMGVQLELVLVHIREELISAENFSDAHELIVVVLALEERLLLEDHTSKHAAQRPNVQTVIVYLKVNQEFRSFEVPTCDADIVLLRWMIELRQTPIDKSQLTVRVINHDVVWLNITVHDALRVTEVQSFENLVDVVANIKISERLVECAEINITGVDKLHYECGSFCHRVSHDIEQIDDVHTALQCLKNLYLSPDLRLLD